MSYVVELCGEVGVSLMHPVINALYILGYEVLDRTREEASGKNGGNQSAKLGFRRADEIFNASSMFT
jgi:hypothetical protein